MMPIRSLHVRGYRSIQRVRLRLGQVNVLQGANGGGKSNLYRSLYLLAAAAEGRFARTLAGEGGMASALWAGEQNKGVPNELRLRLNSTNGRTNLPVAYRHRVNRYSTSIR